MALTSTQVPTPIVISTFPTRASGTPTHAESFTAGQVTVAAPLSRNAVYLDQLAIFGGSNLASVLSGLALSAGTGLQALCATGFALCSGVIEIASGLSITLNPSTTTFIWLLPNGTLARTTTSTPPSTPAVYLGAVTTSSSAVTAIDTSGVLFMFGSMPVRTVGDTGAPSDTPPSGTWFATKTGNGTYIWDGGAYHKLA